MFQASVATGGSASPGPGGPSWTGRTDRTPAGTGRLCGAGRCAERPMTAAPGLAVSGRGTA